MSLTNFPNGLTSFGIPLTGPGSASLIPSLVTSKVYFVNSTSGSDGNTGTSVQRPFETVAKALTVAPAGSVIYLAPGEYDESVTVATANLTIVGMGGRGAAYIAPSAAGAEAMQVTADDVTLINVGVDGDDTASYGLNVNAASRFRAYGCKFELGSGAGPAVLLNGTADGQVGDAILSDCEFAWAGIGLQADDSAYGYVTQVLVQNCRFHNITTACIGVATNGLYKNLEVVGCFFDNAEDGTPPTDYVLLSDNGNTGLFTQNSFATATNDTGVLTIGTGILWAANATEAGFSTARPA